MSSSPFGSNACILSLFILLKYPFLDTAKGQEWEDLGILGGDTRTYNASLCLAYYFSYQPFLFLLSLDNYDPIYLGLPTKCTFSRVVHVYIFRSHYLYPGLICLYLVPRSHSFIILIPWFHSFVTYSTIKILSYMFNRLDLLLNWILVDATVSY